DAEGLSPRAEGTARRVEVDVVERDGAGPIERAGGQGGQRRDLVGDGARPIAGDDELGLTLGHWVGQDVAGLSAVRCGITSAAKRSMEAAAAGSLMSPNMSRQAK